MMVRLFADECVAGSIIEQLRSEGFDIVKAADICPTADDYQVLAEAYREGRVLITADKDFGELVVRQGHQAHGVVNLALGDLASATRARITSARLRELGDRVVGSIVTIEPGRVRLRPLP
jgi:predicted nuclease of predicted toxin-antitoxin system